MKALRLQVWGANMDLSHSGLARLTWGNASGIDRARGWVAIKPSGVPYDKLRPEDIVVVDLDGRPVDGALRPSSDTATHLELYRRFPAIGGVVHTHSVYATVFAQACRPIPCVGTTHADTFHGPVPVTRALTARETASDYERNTGRVIAEAFEDLDPAAVPGVLVAHHGPFTWGADAAAAVNHALALELVAQMAHGTLLLNRAARLPRHILERHYRRKHGPAATYGQGDARPAGG